MQGNRTVKEYLTPQGQLKAWCHESKEWHLKETKPGEQVLIFDMERKGLKKDKRAKTFPVIPEEIESNEAPCTQVRYTETFTTSVNADTLHNRSQ